MISICLSSLAFKKSISKYTYRTKMQERLRFFDGNEGRRTSVLWWLKELEEHIRGM